MPELPDLEVFSRNLTKQLKAKTLEQVWLDVNAKTGLSQKALEPVLSGKKLKAVSRVGKQLCFNFGANARLFVQLMRHGAMVLQPYPEERPRHSVAQLLFSDMVLSITDIQKKARLSLTPPTGGALDAHAPELTSKWLAKALEGSRSQIKTLLINQKVIAGIGHVYADEILWEARIDPGSIAGKIPADKVDDLVNAIKKVLKDAEKKILHALPEMLFIEVRSFLKIHNSNKQSSPTGYAILKTTTGGRNTYYTLEQVVYT